MEFLPQLSSGALNAILNGGVVVDPIFQILGSKKLNVTNPNQNRYRINLSDGRNSFAFAMLSISNNDATSNIDVIESYCIVKITNYVANMMSMFQKGNTRVIILLNWDVLVRGIDVGCLIGNPVVLSELSTTQTNNSQSANNNNNLDISPIARLNPFHNNWIIKARVMNKSTIRTWNNNRGEGKLFSIDLIDSSGDIRCTVFSELVEKYYSFFEVDKVYFLSKCTLKIANRAFNSTRHRYEMTLLESTLVIESIKDNDNVPHMKYNFTMLDKISSMEAGTVVDVIGVCKSVTELVEFTSKNNKNLRKKEVTLVDQTLRAITIVFWGDQAQKFDGSNFPVILFKSAKLTEFGGSKSLNVSFATLVKINPDIPIAQELRNWYDLNGCQQDFQNISKHRAFGGAWMTLKELQNQQDSFVDQACFFQVFATILMVRSDRAVYKACPTADCQKKVIDMENGLYRCDKCNREFSEYKYRFLVSMLIADLSSSQWVTVFSTEAEKILRRTAEQIGRSAEESGDFDISVFDAAQFNQYVFKCRAKFETFNDDRRFKVVVTAIDNSSMHKCNSYFLKKIIE